MPQRQRILKIAIAGGLGLSIAGGGWWLAETGRAAHQAQLEEAYIALLPRPAPAITHRHYEVRGVFTDTVERFRFAGGDPQLVQAIAQRYDLQPVQQPLESKFSAPDWWVLPSAAEYHLRGAGHEYLLLVFDPATGQVFVERTQD